MTGKRQYQVKVTLNDQEAARLDELRGGVSRAVYLRGLLHEPPKDDEIATHGESLAILSLPRTRWQGDRRDRA